MASSVVAANGIPRPISFSTDRSVHALLVPEAADKEAVHKASYDFSLFKRGCLHNWLSEQVILHQEQSTSLIIW